MTTIAVLNQKGGVGKTTLAVNLGGAAHVDGRRTLIVDMDVQGSATDWYAARADDSPLAGLVVMKMDKRLTVPKFKELSTGYDFVVLDGPPRLDDVTQSAAVAADVALIPVSPGPFDLWATSSTLKTLDHADEIRDQLGRSPVRRVFVVNRAEVGGTLTRELPEVLAEGENEVLETVVHQRIAFKKSALKGECVLTFGGDEAAMSEVKALYRAVVGKRK
jgi:chromosome partitioning protein